MNEILQGEGLVNVAEDHVHVTGLKGPLEDGWKAHVAAFADWLHNLATDATAVDQPTTSTVPPSTAPTAPPVP